MNPTTVPVEHGFFFLLSWQFFLSCFIALLLGWQWERAKAWWQAVHVGWHKAPNHYPSGRIEVRQLGLAWSTRGWGMLSDDHRWDTTMFDGKVYLIWWLVLIDIPGWPRLSTFGD